MYQPAEGKPKVKVWKKYCTYEWESANECKQVN